MTEEQRAVVAAAVAWYRACGEWGPIDQHEDSPLGTLAALALAVETHLERQEPKGPRPELVRPLTWGTVPAGWYVQTPGGDWMLITHTATAGGDTQHVTMDVAGHAATFPRTAGASVIACPGPLTSTDAALSALGFPRVLEDGC